MNRQSLLQLFADAFIPLAGAFLFDWSLYFILLFYCLDLIASEFIIHLKSKKVVEFSGISKKRWLKNGLGSGVLVALAITLIHVSIYYIQQGIDFEKEFFDFMMYEELGIPQGYVLIPLVVFSAYQLYRMNFLMPAKFRTLQLDEIWKPHFQSLVVILFGALVTIGLSQVIVFHDWVYVISIVAISSAYQIWMIRKGQSKR